ncbi:hypothetical protein CF57_14925 [Escherichia coli]|nr:hypothetical protein BU34_26435 [Escherichia coli]AHM34636.1 hypothetical protein CF57_14925 [Escherichia coli]AHM39234.1 hypothetical protein CF61_15660 [Escherichia coli]AQV78880.1 hypothetical protein BE962_11635 [Escherichia coli]PMD73974.1 hypothetical protein A8A11_08660 [Escherichia coli]
MYACHDSTLQMMNPKGCILTIFLTRQDTYRIGNNLFTQKAMSWRKTICPEGLSVPLLLSDCNNRYYSKGNDSNLLIVFYVQIMPDDFVMQLHRF